MNTRYQLPPWASCLAARGGVALEDVQGKDEVTKVISAQVCDGSGAEAVLCSQLSLMLSSGIPDKSTLAAKASELSRGSTGCGEVQGREPCTASASWARSGRAAVRHSPWHPHHWAQRPAWCTPSLVKQPAGHTCQSGTPSSLAHSSTGHPHQLTEW